MIGPTCPRCGWVHGSDAARAIGVFSGLKGWRANYPDAPLRQSRDDAETDYCNHQRTRR